MKRARFVGSALAFAGAPSIVRAQNTDVRSIVERIPGITGVYARTFKDTPLVAIRDGEPFAAASVIKLAIMLTAYRAFDAGTASPSDKVKLRAADIIGGSDFLAGSHPGEAFSLQQLIRAMIQVSDNAASNTLITAFGMEAINATAIKAGLTGTHLGRHFADVVPAWRVSQNVTTPRDMATLMFGLERGSREGLDTIARSASCRAMIGILLGQEDRNKIPAGLPPGTPIANKTGEIDGVRNDIAIVNPYGDTPFVLAVMTKELRDTSAGNRGIAAIARAINASVAAEG